MSILNERIERVLAKPPEFLTLNTNPNASERYRGRYLTLNGIPQSLGRLLGQGDEAFVFELISLNDGHPTAVVKICRHPPGGRKYATWAVPYRLERNPHSAIPDVELHLARLVRIPGGLVKVQKYLAPCGTINWSTDEPVALINEVARRGDIGGALESAQALIDKHGPRGILLETQGHLLVELERWEEARNVLEQALEAHRKEEDAGRLRTGILLALTLREIYNSTPTTGDASLSLKLSEELQHRVVYFKDPNAAGEDDTGQDRAMFVLLEVLADEPYFIPALSLLADELMSTGGTIAPYVDAAGKVIDAIERIDPDTSVEIAKQVRQRFREDFEQARQNIQASHQAPEVQEHPPTPQRLSEVSNHMTAFDEAYTPDPDRGQVARARFESAQSHLLLGKPEKAVHAALEATKLDPTVADYPLILAEALHRQGEYQEALRILTQASVDFYDDAVVHEALGDFHFTHEDYAAAKLAYLRALHSEPAELWYVELGLGRTYQSLGERDKAVETLRSALQHNPLERAIVFELVYALGDREMGATDEEVDESEDIVRTAVERWPDDAGLLSQQAELQIQEGLYPEAMATLKRAMETLEREVELNPDHPVPAAFLAKVKNWYHDLESHS